MVTRFYKTLAAAKREATRQNNRFHGGKIEVEAAGNAWDGFYVEWVVKATPVLFVGSLSKRTKED